MHAQNTGTQKFLLRKSEERFDTGIVKKVRKFQFWAKKPSDKKYVCGVGRAMNLFLTIQRRDNIHMGKILQLSHSTGCEID